MAGRRLRTLPAFDVLEGRQLLSSAPWPGTFVTGSGDVTTRGGTAEVTVSIPASQFQKLPTTYFQITLSPDPSSGLNPQVVAVHGPNGEPLRVRPGKPFVRGFSSATVFVNDSEPGPITVDVTGRRGTTGSFQLGVTLPGDVLGTGQVTLADERAFAAANLSHQGQPAYNPMADANQNGKVGQSDGRLLLRNFAPLTPPIPQRVFLSLSPAEQAHVPAKNSGGITYQKDVTIYGSTTPGSLIFSDSGLGDYSFKGPAFSTDPQGRFLVPVELVDGINNFQFLVIDPFGHHTIRAFPIMWLGFKP